MQKKKYYIIIASLFVVTIIGAWTLIKDKNKLNNEKQISESSKQIEMQEKDSIKDLANNFTLKNLEGTDVSLSDFQGKNVILNFWTTWCEPCVAEMDDFQKIYDEFKGENFEIIAVNVGEDQETVKKFFEDGKYTFECLLDQESKVTYEYNVTSVPTTYVINKSGEIEGIFRGQISYDTIKGIKTVLES